MGGEVYLLDVGCGVRGLSMPSLAASTRLRITAELPDRQQDRMAGKKLKVTHQDLKKTLATWDIIMMIMHNNPIKMRDSYKRFCLGGEITGYVTLRTQNHQD